MHPDARRILDLLTRVEHERSRRLADPALGAAVALLKRYQRDRFARTYADLLASPRYAAAARFFLDELYGPQDFSQRDAQFARVVPALVRLFPEEIVATVETLAQLHALSESLDSAMGEQLRSTTAIAAGDYVHAWQAVGGEAERERQIARGGLRPSAHRARRLCRAGRGDVRGRATPGTRPAGAPAASGRPRPTGRPRGTSPRTRAGSWCRLR